MAPGHAFDTTISGTSYQFVNITSRTLQPTAMEFILILNIPIYEGSWVTTQVYCRYLQTRISYSLYQMIMLIFLHWLLSIQTSSGDTTLTTFTKANTLVEVKSTTNAYFIQETLRRRMGSLFWRWCCRIST